MSYTLTIDIPRPPLSSNDQRRAHWTKVRTAKAHVETLVAAEVRKVGVPRLDKITVLITWFAPDARARDVDSLGPFLKASLDALVKSGVLVDDNSRFVREASTRIDIDRARPRIEIELKEVIE